MKIHVYTCAWNEEAILPHFLRHYADFAEKIVVYDNGSDDRTPDIAASHPQTQLRVYDTKGALHDGKKADLLSTCYRESRGVADWVICVDTDELLFHENLLGTLRRYLDEGVTFPRVAGYSMVTDERVPDPSRFQGRLCDRFVRGAPNPNFDKRCIFRPELDVRYAYGQHQAVARGDVVENPTPELKLLHYKHFHVDYVWKRYQMLRPRLSRFNRFRKLGAHYRESKARIQASHDRYKKHAVNVRGA